MTSLSCVARTTVVPSWLIFSKQLYDLEVWKGSRLPVGSSAMTTSGRWIMARAIATRCLFAAGKLVRENSSSCRRGPPFRAPAERVPRSRFAAVRNFERKRNIFISGFRRQKSEILENDADMPAESRQFVVAEFIDLVLAKENAPFCRPVFADQYFDNSDLPAPERPARETNSPGSISKFTSSSAVAWPLNLRETDWKTIIVEM